MIEENDVTDIKPNIKTMNENRHKPFRMTMEFPVFFSMLSVSLAGAAVSNIILYRTCIHSLNHTQEECHDFLSPVKNNGTHDLEEPVQKYATVVATVRTIIESLTPAVLALFLGVWSDKHGRKPLVVWSLLGMTISGGLIVIYSMLDNLGPWWFILTSIPMSVSGGYTAMFTGAFCYVSDISAEDKRSLRMTMIQTSMSAGTVVGSVLSSFLLRAVGYVYLLLISASFYAVACLFTIFCLKESITGAVKGKITSVLDYKLVKTMLVTCFKQRPNHGRAQVLLLAMANSLATFVLFGHTGVQYWYTRQKLQWSIQEYTIYSAVHLTTSFFGSYLGVLIIQKLLKVPDLWFAMISLLSAATDYIIIAFATLSWHMYFGGGISLFQTLSTPLIRSLLTKILPSEDVAKVFALMSAIEGVSPLISPALYNSLYAYTISSFPGAMYLLSTGICTFCVALLGMMILDASISLGTFTGNLLSSYLIATMGNVYLLLFTATLNVIAFVFAKVCIVESLTGALQNGASQVFDFSHAKKNSKECFSERPNRGRPQIIIIAIVRLFILMITIGILSLEYLYTRQKLDWYLRDFTTYSAVTTAIAFFGGVLGVIVLQRLLQFGDIPISIMALLSSAADTLIKLFAVHSWQMYLGSTISLFKGLTGPLMRSYVTKSLPAKDVAKVFALLCVAESLAHLLFLIPYTRLLWRCFREQYMYLVQF